MIWWIGQQEHRWAQHFVEAHGEYGVLGGKKSYYSFVTSLAGDKGSDPAVLYPKGNKPGTHWIEEWVVPGAQSWYGRKCLRNIPAVDRTLVAQVAVSLFLSNLVSRQN